MKHFPFGPYNCCNATEIAEHNKKKRKTELKTFLPVTVAATGNSLIQRWSPLLQTLTCTTSVSPAYSFPATLFRLLSHFSGVSSRTSPPPIFQLDFPFLSSDCCAISFVLLGELLMFYA